LENITVTIHVVFSAIYIFTFNATVIFGFSNACSFIHDVCGVDINQAKL